MKNICSYILTENSFFSTKKLLNINILFTPLFKRIINTLDNAGCSNHIVLNDDMENFMDLDIDNLTLTCDKDFACDFIKGFDGVIVSHADMALLDSNVIKEAVESYKDGTITVLTTYDRIIKNDCEGSVFILDKNIFCEFLKSKMDIYDFAKAFRKLTFIEVDSTFCSRIFDNLSLIEIKEAARQKVLYTLCDKGVTFETFDGVVIDETSTIEENATILPGTIIKENSYIKSGAIVGPNSFVSDSKIGKNTIFKSSYTDKSFIGDNVTIGPFCNIRPDCTISNGVKIGDFVEVKNSSIGQKTSVAHLTYVGDSDVGCKVNFGCGTVTVNYDGKNKYRTTIGNNVFIGCNTNFIAPVKIEDDTFIAAGSTITKDVPKDALAIARARQENKIGYAKKFLK